MKDAEFRKSRKDRSKDFHMNARFIVFLSAVVLMFGILFMGLYRLQIVDGASYRKTF